LNASIAPSAALSASLNSSSVGASSVTAVAVSVLLWLPEAPEACEALK
jgi:hypothetical protein